jgi:N-acetylmuramoyl-L-alanine amidase
VREIIIFKIIFLFLLFTPLIHASDNIRNEVIIIDVGHSVLHPGAISASGRGEFFYNLDIAEALYQEFHRKEFTNIVFIKAYDKVLPIHERIILIKTNRPRLLISIHHDSVQPSYLSKVYYKDKLLYYCDQFQGYSVFYSHRNIEEQKSVLLAKMIGTELRNIGLVPTIHHAENIHGEMKPLIDRNLGIYRYDNLSILTESSVPSVLVECGVIVNRKEDKLLQDPEYQVALAKALVRAVENFLLNKINPF